MTDFTSAQMERARDLLNPKRAAKRRRKLTLAAAATEAARTPPPPPLHGRVAFEVAGTTAGQAAALAAVAAFVTHRTRRTFLLAGAAGTGKTHTTIEIVRGLLAAGIEVRLTATTNKAARVLRARAAGVACPKVAEVFRRATTVARFLHRRRRVVKDCRASAAEQHAFGLDADAEVHRVDYLPVATAANEGTVVIVDKVSMLSHSDDLTP